SGLTTVSINDSAVGVNTLTVNGTNGNDAITAARLGANNIVWVNAQAVVVFNGNFNQLNLAGRFGNDSFIVSPAGITLAGATPHINVTDVTLANSTLQVNGSVGSDLIGYRPTGPATGSVTENTALADVVFTNVPNVSINGQGGSDQLTYVSP